MESNPPDNGDLPGGSLLQLFQRSILAEEEERMAKPPLIPETPQERSERIARQIEADHQRRKSGKLLQLTPDEQAHFDTLINTTISSDGCHLWTGSRDDGHGVFKVLGTSVRARHVVWYKKHGHPPRGQLASRCANRLCVRPDHLCMKRDFYE